MRILAIVQARMGSKRLPGKVLREIHQKPMLKYLIDRILLVKNNFIDFDFTIATSNLICDDLIEEYCIRENINCFRGSEKDVLKRFYECASIYRPDYIVRLTGDNPLVCPYELGKLINEVIEANYDYVSNRYSLPLGMGAEIFTYRSLIEAHYKGVAEYHREHVTTYILEQPYQFKIKENKNLCYGSYRLTVDTLEDFEVVKNILNHFGEKWPHVKKEEILNYLDDNPKLKLINAHVKQKKVLQ